MKYQELEMELIVFKEEDILTVSQEKEDIWKDFNA